MKGQTQKGMELLEKACRLDPRNAEAQFRLATIYDRFKRFADAVRHFEKVVETDPADARAWDYLALDWEPLGEVERADLAYGKGLAVNQPGPHFDAFLDYNYGRFLMKRNDLAGSQTASGPRRGTDSGCSSSLVRTCEAKPETQE